MWDNLESISELENSDSTSRDEEKLEILLNQSIGSITNHLEKFEFNTAVSDLMKINNQLSDDLKNNNHISSGVKKDIIQNICLLLNPFAPHISSEIFYKNFNTEITQLSWPNIDNNKVENPTYELVIQINGKKKHAMEVPTGLQQLELSLIHI